MAGRIGKKINQDIKSKKKWEAGSYTRRSHKDGENQESDTIKNQRELINQFLKNEKDIEIIEYYADDGYTGTDFNRPDFKRMFNDIVNGKINTIIVKDLSRLGRNYIEVGNFLEYIFPMYNIRFISINDNIDSFKDPKSINNAIVSFKNVMNDEYARDISIKVRSYYSTKAKNGEFAGGTTPYGYMIDPNDKHHLIIDEKEAKIVRMIFNKALLGDGKIKICKYLNDHKVLCRKEIQRRKKRNLSLVPTNEKDKIVYSWSTSTIGRLLSNETYIGSVVQNKSTNINYKVHKTITKPKNEWIVVENKHKPIITKEEFYKVQDLIKSRTVEKKDPKNYSIYNRKLKCANCGKAMYRMDDFRNGRESSNYYCMNHKITSSSCTSHKIKASVLDNIVLELVLMQVKMVMSLDKALVKLKEEHLNQELEQKYNTNINKLNNDIDKYKKLKKSCYEDWKFGKITKEEFVLYSKSYDDSIENTTREIVVLEKVYEENIRNLKKDDYWIEHFRRNKKVKVLSKDVIEELIDIIYVHNDGNVTVNFKYQDEYEQTLKFLNEEVVKTNV